MLIVFGDEQDGGGIGSADGGGRSAPQPIPGMDQTIVAALESMPGGVLAWTYPAVVMAVPGLLLIVAVVAQMLGGLAWLPVVRRSLSGTGIRRQRAPASRLR